MGEIIAGGLTDHHFRKRPKRGVKLGATFGTTRVIKIKMWRAAHTIVL